MIVPVTVVSFKDAGYLSSDLIRRGSAQELPVARRLLS
jgi:hypothetical protein